MPTAPDPRVTFVAYGSVRSLEDLLAPAAPGHVFTPAERAHCAAVASLSRWAGRLAAKRAVLACLGLDDEGPAAPLHEVEIVPGPHEGQKLPHLCALGHRPVARLSGAADRERRRLGVAEVEVSLSHEDGLAVALAAPRRQTENTSDGRTVELTANRRPPMIAGIRRRGERCAWD